ncbi:MULTISPECIES: tRNA pseudouridine(13) synthase TruD [unclassified Campylobacter]|uniref:tRNA pseudouridine(13) synthase TruD n=1 Tax=unclassified Campylobacter TaxID=2593542 RepID=UPI001237C732|nr:MULTISPECIES: tRNA pseudouridine(13) synthase TruD [unclassified Campylobacter]KAA6227156.1 tRNA pseudouridine(13) synthase TruD [Campylobacter sp. LR185c]KAA6227447.1 tRNA pseudouridine(13) synthase TruD [Campylobacter sp. LR196d]KAA6228474.1 tRNA pseudouridine(13) synthase TruD [Campylobacter sp. LR286c]KAA6233499.1 tRNA pseudouridine(13) synthase TruD [Campylobacter sp. LR264d]KAA8603782.1 tRNA pseudouridine(13) synthase TruD [Campylobacter sp. LR185c]
MNLSDENTIFKPLFALKHSKIDAYFSKNSKDFVVREVPLYEFSGSGEHLILQICKKDLSTNEALQILSEISGVKIKDFGYAGLKDKQGLTYQYLSMPKKMQHTIENFSHEKLKIINLFTHNNKLKIGHLKGNSFFIRLKKVSKIDALKLEEAFKMLDKEGFANYFGYQRFGKFKDNFQSGLEILQGKKMKNKRMQNFLISAFQSELFNRYLSKRVQLSHFMCDFSIKELAQIYKIDKDELRCIKEQKQFFKLLKTEVLSHYPFGKCFICENLNEEVQRFINKQISPTGALFGEKMFECENGFAKDIEEEIFNPYLQFKSQMQGSRRYLWSFMQNTKFTYDEEKAHFCMEFFLQKGSYATQILSELLHDEEYL